MSGGGAPSPDYTASNEEAAITGQQWANFQSLYQPVEDQQIAYADNPAVPLQAANQAGVTADAQAQAVQQGLAKKLGGEGITLTPEQKQAMSERQNISAGLGKVGAMNKAAVSAYDTQSRTLSGGAPNPTTIGNPSQLSQNL